MYTSKFAKAIYARMQAKKRPDNSGRIEYLKQVIALENKTESKRASDELRKLEKMAGRSSNKQYGTFS